MLICRPTSLRAQPCLRQARPLDKIFLPLPHQRLPIPNKVRMREALPPPALKINICLCEATGEIHTALIHVPASFLVGPGQSGLYKGGRGHSWDRAERTKKTTP